MRPHSADLRRRIVTLYERGEGSIRQLAKRFQVSPDSVRCLIKQYRASGSISPKPYTGGPQPTLQATHHEVLRELIETDNDATLAQLAQRLAIRTGTQVSDYNPYSFLVCRQGQNRRNCCSFGTGVPRRESPDFACINTL